MKEKKGSEYRKKKEEEKKENEDRKKRMGDINEDRND